MTTDPRLIILIEILREYGFMPRRMDWRDLDLRLAEFYLHIPVDEVTLATLKRCTKPAVGSAAWKIDNPASIEAPRRRRNAHALRQEDG